MTPLAQSVFRAPLEKPARDAAMEAIAGAQFFDCTALAPLVHGSWRTLDHVSFIRDMVSLPLPAEKCWLEIAGVSVCVWDRGNEGERAAFVFEPPRVAFPFLIYAHRVDTFPNSVWGLGPGVEADGDRLGEVANSFAAIAAICLSIIASETPGLRSLVPVSASRQIRRTAERLGAPCHKWVRVILGRPRAPRSAQGPGISRGVCWHYRRGHAVSHPNPNYPKWRRGSWVGDPALGVRSHVYAFEDAK